MNPSWTLEAMSYGSTLGKEEDIKDGRGNKGEENFLMPMNPCWTSIG